MIPVDRFSELSCMFVTHIVLFFCSRHQLNRQFDICHYISKDKAPPKTSFDVYWYSALHPNNVKLWILHGPKMDVVTGWLSEFQKSLRKRAKRFLVKKQINKQWGKKGIVRKMTPSLHQEKTIQRGNLVGATVGTKNVLTMVPYAREKKDCILHCRVHAVYLRIASLLSSHKSQ